MTLPTLAAVLVSAAVLAAGAAAPGVEAFVARIDAAAAIAAEDQPPSAERMHRLRGALGLVEVEVGGATVRVAGDPLIDRLEGTSAADFDRATARLGALRHEAVAVDGSALLDRAQLDDRVDAALAKVDPEPGWRERISRALLGLLGRVVDAIARALSGTSPGAAGWLVAALIGMLAAVALLRRVRGVPDRVARRSDAAGRDAVDWERDAVAALGRGDLEAAVRARYRQLLAALAASGVVRLDPSLTAGECRAAVAARRPAWTQPVATATDIFEHVRFARAPVTVADVDTMGRAVRAVR